MIERGEVEVDVSFRLNGKEYRSAINIELQDGTPLKPIRTSDDVIMAIASGGNVMAGSRQEYALRYERDKAVHKIFSELAKHIAKQLSSIDTLNGYPKEC